ncbi:glycine/D-amino acid oxidase-like deaminating enzyme [Sphaerisporangium krabiense]|uniref:Glycine/D-amino acid oxidase-like deaminating enzyme n=1 Tax=Sphaerisporangium krabiense TaxID=763782 RepID=A0A7W9DSP6_9ACTN|nr:glycine/D-amino acid oxidase-like deaminating enzyme [Sphaerisporangium krabiense]
MDSPDKPEPLPRLFGDTTADLAVVGGGFSGLWAALMAKERDPSLDVVLLEGRRVGWAASGRNGGFCAASLTHGIGNGLSRWPREIATLVRLGAENLDEIERAVAKYSIDCGFERTGELHVATEPWQLDEMAEEAGLARELGMDTRLLDAAEVRAEVDSPTYLGGQWDRDGCAMLDPARLAWGLREACLSLGVRVHERTPVRSLRDDGTALELVTPHGVVRAGKVALGTGVFPPLLGRLRNFLVPVYDYALMTEPLTAGQLASVGWSNRQGIGDSGNQFHYYRLTEDDRVLWGGYDAVYFNGGKIRPEYDQRDETFATLAGHFYATFPQLEGVRFTHRWGGVIDTCSRFSAFYGTAHKGRLAYAAGYTGLGVGATRFGANVMLDLLSGRPTERTELQMVREKPVPFPPEPIRSGVIQLTRWSIAQADAHQGRRNLWLRTLDRLGLGFDS